MKNKNVGEFFITTLNGMAHGLFATLIIGTILGTIGTLFGYGVQNPALASAKDVFKALATVFQCLTGAGIGVGIALALKFDSIKTVVLGVVGEAAAFFSLSTKYITDKSHYVFNYTNFQIGDPLTIYIVCVIVALGFKYLLIKKTPVDIILIPLFGALAGLGLSLAIRYPAIYVTYGIQYVVNSGTNVTPFVMGIVVSVIMGMALTAPISSAAIAAMIFVIPKDANPSDYQGLILASGAAVVGCSTQMIGFAIQSRKDNDLGKVISVAIGTSMLQFKNILRHPIVWLPTIIASAILGPISTCLLHLSCLGSSAGMGTAGLVGQIGTFTDMTVGSWQAWVGVLGLQIIFPAILVFAFDLVLRKLNLIKPGDLKI